MYHYKADVIRVVDGDTVDVVIDLGFRIKIEQRIRLLGINAPESRTSNPLEREAGKLVTSILKRSIEGTVVTIRTEKPMNDKYGRFLAHIASEDRVASYNDTMAKLRLVEKYDGGKMNKWTDERLREIIDVGTNISSL